MGSATAMPERLDGLVELVHQRKTGQYEPHTFRLLQREAHIFDKVLDEKSRFEVSLKNTWSEMVQGPAGCGSATDRVQHPLQIEPCLGAIEQTLADTDHRTGDHDLVTEFSLLPSAGPSLMHDLLTQQFEERHDGLYCFAVASHHDREGGDRKAVQAVDRKSTRLNSSHLVISYAV